MNKDKVLNILLKVSIVIVSLLAVFIIYYIVTNRIMKRINPNYVPLITMHTVISNSMYPELKIYDLLLDVKVGKNTKIKKGDIITFIPNDSLSNNQTITHRVIDIINEDGITYYKTKGDNNNEADEMLITKDNIKGKFLFKIPKIGKFGYKV